MRIVFMGTPDAAVPSLKRCLDDGHHVIAVWTQPDRPAGRGNRLHAPPIKEFALGNNLAVYQPEKIRTDQALELLKSHDADVAVVVAYGRILPSSFLKVPKFGCINVHFSLLPRYRGAAPVNWAIVRGETETGVTTIQIDDGLDTGDILLQRATQIGEKETAVELMSRLSGLGAQLLSETLSNLATIPSREQEHAMATLAPIMKREDGHIDWTHDASTIERLVRGLQPWPCAHTSFASKRVLIWRADEVRSEKDGVAPGSVIEASGDRLTVSCGGSTALSIRELQIEGKRRMSVRDFLNGARASVGDRFE